MSGRLWSLLVFGIVAAFPGNADLSQPDPRDARLTGPDLSSTHRHNANLIYANLIGAERGGPDVSSDDLIGANLSGANLSQAHYTGKTRLPTSSNNVQVTGMILEK